MSEKIIKQDQKLLKITQTQQYRTADELIEKSKPSAIYLVLLVLSSLIVTSGLLLNNSAIVIGGMLVTPLLTPMLAIGLGIAIGSTKLMKRTGILLVKSFLAVIIGSLLMALVFGSTEGVFDIENAVRTTTLYFIVAIASGIAATFGWLRKEISEVLPGIAIAVSVVPPMSLIGIWLADLQYDAIRFYFTILLTNFLGIVMGSLIVFSLLKFYKTEKKIEKKVETVEKEQMEKRKTEKNHTHA